MNKLKKIGLTALAGSLVAGSVNAAEMSVSGSASINFTGGRRKRILVTVLQWVTHLHFLLQVM